MLEALNKRIETPDIVDHERELNKRLGALMLAFAEKKYSIEKEKNPELKISTVIEENTDLFFGLENIMRYERNLTEDEVAIWKNEFKKKIDAIYEQGGDWTEMVYSLFLEEKAKYETTPSEARPEKEFAGVINYNLRAGEHGLEEYGFDKNLDQALEIHLEEFFKHPDKKISTREILESFTKLAEVIVNKFPQIKVIIAESWLMDHPLFKKMGFQITQKPSDTRTPNHWLQFVDRDGQIDQQKVDQLLQSGEFPYQSRVAYFPVMDFLQKYLPKERRGKKIILRDLKPGFKESSAEIEAEGQKFSAAWLKLTPTDIDNFQNLFPKLSALMENLKLLDELKEVLLRMKKRNDDWGQGRNREIEFFNKFEKRRNEYLAKEATIEREVVIE